MTDLQEGARPHKNRQHDVIIELTINDPRGLMPRDLLEHLDSLESVLHESDRRDVEQAAEELNIPSFIRDASLERVKEFRHTRLSLKEVHSGSFVFEFAVLGVGYWVLDKVLLQAINDGLKETRAYERLKDFFRRQIDRKVQFITNGIRRRLPSHDEEVSVESKPATANVPTKVAVAVTIPKPPPVKPRVKTFGEVLADEVG